MGDVFAKLGDGLWNAVLMAWEVWWALVLGFAVSAIVQAWVPRNASKLPWPVRASGRSPAPPAWERPHPRVPTRRSRSPRACSRRARAPPRALAFQFASTNLVWELGLPLWVLIGWQFTLAEYLGGLVMIALMWALLRLFVSPTAEQQAASTPSTPPPGISTTPPASR